MLLMVENIPPHKPVSYTHLDVYKRQSLGRSQAAPDELSSNL